MKSVKPSKVQEQAVQLCERAGLSRLASSVKTSKAPSLTIFFSAKTHKEGCPFRVIVSERGTWQREAAVFLQKCLSHLDVEDPFLIRKPESVSEFLQTTRLPSISGLRVRRYAEMSPLTLTWRVNSTRGCWQVRGFELICHAVFTPGGIHSISPHQRTTLSPRQRSVAVDNLQPGSVYTASLCILDAPGGNACRRTTFRVAEAERLHGDQPTLLRVERSAKQPETLGDSTGTGTSGDQSVMVLRIMACCVLLFLTGLTLIVFLTSSTGFPDVVAQICCEFSIMAAYTCILMTTTDQPKLTEKQCLAAAVCLQFFFLSAFLFLLLESVYVCRLLAPALVPHQLPFTGASMAVAGFGVPAIVTGVSAGTLGDKYTRQGQICWLDLSERASYATTVPVCLCVLLQLFFLAAVFFCTRPQRHMSARLFHRARTQTSTKWASLILVSSTALSWASGVAAEHQRSRGLYVCFSVATIMLGVFVITLRITTEDQVRRRLMAKMGVSNAVDDVSPCSSVLSWSRESLSSSRNSFLDSHHTVSAISTSESSVHRIKGLHPPMK